ncbi:MAG TPA: FHA domain-containing protein, partial [Myxococcota bacterium]
MHRGGELVDTQVFERDIIKIGRLQSAHLRLEDPKVSRIHAVIDIAAGNEVSIIDMGSAEGTRVNGDKVSRVRLKHGDEVGLGDSRLVVVLDDTEIAALKGGGAATSAPSGTSVTSLTDVVAPMGVPVDSAPASAQGQGGFEGGLPAHTGVFTSGPTDVNALRAELNSTLPSNVATSEVFARPPVDAPLSIDAPRTAPLMQSPLAAPTSRAAAPTQPPSGATTQPPARSDAPSSFNAAPTSIMAAAAIRPSGGAARTSPPAAARGPAISSPPKTAETGPIPGGLISVAPPLPPIPEDQITPENRFVEVTLKWGNDVVECKRVRRVPRVIIGKVEKKVGIANKDDKEPSFFVPLGDTVQASTFDLLRSSPTGGWVVRYTAGMTGNVSRGDANVPLANAGGQSDGEGFALPLTDDTRVELVIGQFTVQVRVVPKSKIIPIAPIFDVLWANTAVVT